MYCPECGTDAGEAKFCPECGADLAGLKNALKGKTTGQMAAGGKGGGQGQRPPKQQAAAAPASGGGKGLSPAMIWGGFGVIAVGVSVLVVVVSGGLGGSGANNDSAASTASATPVLGVTTGSYAELVQKANNFYDQGDAAFQASNFNQGTSFFQAAAMTYAAAWKKQNTDPGVGTDFATSLFYSGNIDRAITQINTIIKRFPNYQAAFFNLGNYMAHKARIAAQQGDTAAAKVANAAATQAYTRAVALDPKSTVGKEADASLKQLQPSP